MDNIQYMQMEIFSNFDNIIKTFSACRDDITEIAKASFDLVARSNTTPSAFNDSMFPDIVSKQTSNNINGTQGVSQVHFSQTQVNDIALVTKADCLDTTQVDSISLMTTTDRIIENSVSKEQSDETQIDISSIFIKNGESESQDSIEAVPIVDNSIDMDKHVDIALNSQDAIMTSLSHKLVTSKNQGSKNSQSKKYMKKQLKMLVEDSQNANHSSNHVSIESIDNFKGDNAGAKFVEDNEQLSMNQNLTVETGQIEHSINGFILSEHDSSPTESVKRKLREVNHQNIQPKRFKTLKDADTTQISLAHDASQQLLNSF